MDHKKQRTKIFLRTLILCTLRLKDFYGVLFIEIMKKHMRDKKRILGLLKLAIIIVLGNAVFLYMMIGIPVCRTIFKDFTQFEEVTGFYTDNHEKESIETDYLYYRFNDIKIAGYSMYFDKDYKKLKEKYLLKGKEKYKDLIICEEYQMISLKSMK